MSKRLFSSDEIVAALRRGGFEQARKSKGSHATFKRLRPDGTHDVTVVVLGKSEVPKPTLDGILRLAGVQFSEFLEWAQVKKRGGK